MVLRSLIVSLSIVCFAPAVDARPAPRARPALKKADARKRPAPRVVKRAPPRRPHAQARPSQLIQRPPVVDLGGGADAGGNQAPEGGTPLERELQSKLDALVNSSYLKSAINGV